MTGTLISRSPSTSIPTAAVNRRKVGRPRKDSNTPSVRESLIALTRQEVAAHGPLAVNARTVCMLAGVTFANVNYNFGTWNGLLAEAAAATYVDFVESIWAQVQAAPHDAEARFRAWVSAQVTWHQANPGWGAFFVFPVSAEVPAQLMREKAGKTISGYFTLNLARLGSLVRDLRDGTVTDFPYDTNNFPRAEMAQDTDLVLRANSIGWSIMGLAVWKAGSHVQRDQVPEIDRFEAQIEEFHIAELIASARRGAH